MPALDLPTLEGRLNELIDHYATLRAIQAENLTYWDGSFEDKVPIPADKGIITVMPQTGRNAIDIPASHIVTDKPVVKRRRETHSDAQHKDDDAIEAFDQAFLLDNEENAITPPLLELVRWQLAMGESIINGPLWDREKMAEQSGWAWYDCLDPTQIYLPPGVAPHDGFYCYKTTVSEMEQLAWSNPSKYGGFKAEGRSLTEEVEIVEWYGFVDRNDVLTRCIIWEKGRGEPIMAFKVSPYPYLPFDRFFTGYGLRAPGAKPEQVAVSILTSQVKQLLREEVFTLSAAGNWMGQIAWPRWRSPTPFDKRKDIAISNEAGSGSTIPDDVQMIEVPTIPTPILQYLSRIDLLLDRALFTGVVRGENPEGVSTVGGLAILAGQARLKFGAPLRLAEGAIARLLERLHRLLVQINKLDGTEEFTIRGRTIKLSQFHGDYTVRVNLLAEDPEERARRIATGLTLKEDLSLQRRQEDYYGIENSTEEIVQMLAEKLLFSDQVQAALAEFTTGVRARLMAENQGQIQGGGMAGLEGMNAMAAMMRAARPGAGGQRPLPGSVEEVAAQMNTATGGNRSGQPY